MKLRTGLLVPLFVAACAGVTASPVGSQRAGDDLLSNLTARGVTVVDSITGDAGCTGLGLEDRAIRLEATIGGDGRQYSIYLFQWPDAQSFNADGGADVGPGAHPVHIYSDCVTAFTGSARRPLTKVESFPWRAFGPEWPQALEQALIDSMHAMGGL